MSNAPSPWSKPDPAEGTDRQAEPIQHVSDTALWVAHYRTMETARPDAHFRDPYAARLAGNRGAEILGRLKGGQRAAWAMVVRTVVFDDLIRRAVESLGVDMVVNLAAGLDARPYRMQLPPELRWVEVDLPEMIDYKESILKDDKPVCRLERVRLDLTDRVGRQALFARLGAEAKKILVVAEGLLIYLTEDDVGSLLDDLHAQPSFAYVLHDLAAPWLMIRLNKQWGKQMANAPFRFAPAQGVGFFRPHGWEPEEERFPFEEAQRLNRNMPGASIWRLVALLFPKKRREEMRRVSLIVLEKRVLEKRV
jgi:methyltransferase (TIGR00027 family)